MNEKLKPFDVMRKHYRERDLAARQWKEQGGKVIGYFYTGVPEELIIAAGCLPLMVTGEPEMVTELGDKYMEDYFCPFVRSVHNLLLMGKYDFLDLLIFPHTNDSIKRTYYYLWNQKKKDPTLPVPPITIFDVLHTKKYIANQYVRGRMAALKENFEGLTGREISEDALRGAVDLCNETRSLLQKVKELRTGDPPLISGVEALQIIGAAFFMPKEEHNRLLREFLDNAENLPAQNGVRLYVSGSILDNTQLYELIESCGATVVAEDVCTGNRYAENPVDTSIDLLDGLTDRYHTYSHEGRMHPLDDLVDYVVQGVQESKAQGALFNYMQWDDSHGWNYPSQRDALEEIGVPCIAFEMQGYQIANTEQLRTRIETFVEMIRGGE
jgi:benzoyl-CoA reductase/2-hydroxyglutaryl-CoA dehydratase subunit BcrC/BadD/HgdB